MRKASIILLLVLLLALLFGCIERTPYSEEEEEKIVLSVFMTKDEIIDKLGEDYEYETIEDDSHTKYHSILKYEGLTIHYHYDSEEMPDNILPETIELKSNKYTYNFDLELGDNALKILRYLGTKFDKYYDPHKDEHAFDIFEYREKTELGSVKDTDYLLKMIYENGEFYDSKEMIPKDLTIVGIIIFIPL
ncbi:MAG: hypothetical protein ACLFPS_06160 [Clostridia bacterium]